MFNICETIFRFGLLAATPLQRFQGMKELDHHNEDKDLLRYALIAVVFLLIVLFTVSYRRIRRERKSSGQLFIEYADQRGLSIEEKLVLQKIIRKSRLRDAASIFSMAQAFENGSEKIRKELFNRQNLYEIQRLDPILASLRQKLGFQRDVSFSKGLAGSNDKATSSRQIPIGKDLVVERKHKNQTESIKAVAIQNTENELVIQLSTPTTIIFGEPWKVRYYYGAFIWEFESFVTRYDGNIMGLSHSDEVHYVNRRRFMRTPVKKNAFIALFPFEKNLQRSIQSRHDLNGDMEIYPEIPLQPMEFVPALVTEMGGPGLKIETSLQIQHGDRILVMFELDRKRQQTSAKNPDTEEITYTYTSTLNIIENIGMVQEAGVVRRSEDNNNTYVIGVELIGLRDNEIDYLIRATNEASLNKNENENVGQKVPAGTNA
jgi:hypothetical protein